MTAEGSKLRGVVWIADGASMVRVSPSHLRTLSEAEKTLCILKDTEAMDFQDLVQRLPNSTYLDLVDQPGPDAEEFESPLMAFRDESLTGSEGQTLPSTSSSSHARPDGPAPAQPVMLPPSTEADEPPTTEAAEPDETRPPRTRVARSSSTLPRPPEDIDMSEARTRPAEESPAGNPVRRRLRRKTGNLTETATGFVFETLGGKEGEN